MRVKILRVQRNVIKRIREVIPGRDVVYQIIFRPENFDFRRSTLKFRYLKNPFNFNFNILRRAE